LYVLRCSRQVSAGSTKMPLRRVEGRVTVHQVAENEVWWASGWSVVVASYPKWSLGQLTSGRYDPRRQSSESP
jgi:hypothetical protein